MLCTCCICDVVYMWCCVHVVDVVLLNMWYYVHVLNVFLCICGTVLCVFCSHCVMACVSLCFIMCMYMYFVVKQV